MLFQIFVFWFLFFLYLTPILLTGIVIFRKILFLDKLELLIPAGSIFGLTLFVFFINVTSFFIKGNWGMSFAYLFLIILIPLFYFRKVQTPKLKLPSTNKVVIFYLLSITFWGVLIFWKGNFALIGSDTNLYYSVAHTFIKGNVPSLTPWQPDLPLVYHLGAFQLLGAFHFFTNLSFEFLHIFFSAFFIFCSSQIIIWLWKRHDNITSFLLGNLAAGIILISFGFLKFAVPISVELPKILNLHQIFLWVRNLPTVNQSIEGYGAPVNLDTLIYFIFHSFGLALVLSLIVLIIYSKGSKILRWIIVAIGLSTLALINESVFVISASALILGGILKDLQNDIFLGIRRFLINNIFTFAILLIMSVFVVVQGGTITNLILGQKSLEKSVLIFPNNADKKVDLISYHLGQTISKELPVKKEWLPLKWFHMGTDILILLCVISFIFIKFSKDQKIVLLTLFIMGICSLLAYYYIVPKYLTANGNRFLAFAFINFSLFLIYSFHSLLDSIKKIFLKSFIFGIFSIFILTPTILPPLAMLSKTRFGENKLLPRGERVTKGVEWIRNNLSYSSKVAVLDVRAPHPSGMARVMVQAGVFAPVFSGKVRVYTIEASPEYFDMAYFLNPGVLQELKISFLLIDSSFFGTLPNLRKTQLGNEEYFRIIFETSNNEGWEKVFEISDKYLKDGGEIRGSFKEFVEIFQVGKIYIDNEENFNPDYLRRAIIFSLREKNLHYLSQSGVYLNVETDINQSNPISDGSYDYLVLGKTTNPKNICQCQTELIWTGLKDEVFVWKRI